MAKTFIALSPQDEPRVEFRSDADMVVLHLDADTSVTMRRAQWAALVDSVGEQS